LSDASNAHTASHRLRQEGRGGGERNTQQMPKGGKSKKECRKGEWVGGKGAFGINEPPCFRGKATVANCKAAQKGGGGRRLHKGRSNEVMPGFKLNKRDSPSIVGRKRRKTECL